MIPAQAAIQDELRQRGFMAKGRTWWRARGVAVQVVNLQRGFGETLHVNLGIYVRELGELAFPREEQCHVRARLERVCPDEFFEPVRSLEASLAPSPQALEALTDHGLVWLDKLSTRAGLCDFLRSEVPFSGFVHVAAQDLCRENHDA